MLTLIDPTATFSHTCKGDEEDPTVFHLKGLSAREKIRVIANPDEHGSYGSTGMECAVRFGLVGWENGSREFKPNDQNSNLDSLPDLVFYELAEEILKASKLLPETKKK